MNNTQNNTLLNEVSSAWSMKDLKERLNRLDCDNAKTLIEDITLVEMNYPRFTVVVHEDDSAQAYIVLSDEDMIEFANNGAKFFRFNT